MKRSKIRAFLLLGILASLGGVTYKVAQTVWLSKASEFRKDPRKLLDYVPESSLQVKNFSRTKIERGKKVWEVSGEEARYLKADAEAVIKRPRIVFYTNDGETIRAVGNEARLFFSAQELERIQLLGKIRVDYQDLVLHTHELHYHKAKSQVVAPGKVTLRREGLELEGVGMELAIDDQTIRLLKKVRTKLIPEGLERRGVAGGDRRKSA